LDLAWLSPVWAAAIGGVLGVVGAIAKNTAAELDDD
jgi:hypothetical protein